VIEQRKSQTNI